MGVNKISGKRAITNYKTIEIYQNKNVPKISLIECSLETGRTHQIRVHSSFMKHPIVGDPLYGRCKKLPCNLKGQALHANKLGLIHPINGENMMFEAELPLEFQKLIKVISKTN